MARTYLITGATSGIGKALKERLDASGARTFGVGRRTTDIVADLGTEAGQQFVIDETTRLADGHLDAVISCAGVCNNDIHDVTINYFAPLRILNGLRSLLAAGPTPRAVVVTSSVVMLEESFDLEVLEACLENDEAGALRVAEGKSPKIYPASKMALYRWMRRVAGSAEWAGSGIALNGVAPGVIETEMTAAALADPEGRRAHEEFFPMPLSGFGKPEQVAPLLEWLASPDNSMLVGQHLYIDGGSDVVRRGDSVGP